METNTGDIHERCINVFYPIKDENNNDDEEEHNKEEQSQKTDECDETEKFGKYENKFIYSLIEEYSEQLEPIKMMLKTKISKTETDLDYSRIPRYNNYSKGKKMIWTNYDDTLMFKNKGTLEYRCQKEADLVNIQILKDAAMEFHRAKWNVIYPDDITMMKPYIVYRPVDSLQYARNEEILKKLRQEKYKHLSTK